MIYHDDRLDKTIPWGESAVWRCKNHPKLRWFGKNMPARSKFFAGEAADETSREAVKQGGIMLDPVHTLRCRLNGINPYNMEPDTSNTYTTLEECEKFIEGAKALGEKYAFECMCPASDLQLMQGGDKEIPYSDNA